MVDMVDAEGKVYTESNNYHFYIDEETHLPVIDAADIPVALYNALVSSIQSDTQFAKVDAEGKSGEEGSETVKLEPAADEVYYDADDVNAASDELQKDDEDSYFDFTDDGEGDITFSAKEETSAEAELPSEDSEDVIPAENAPKKPIRASDLFGGVEDEPEDEIDSEEVITPTYKSGNTVIDKPADNIEFEDELDFEDETPADTSDGNHESSFDSDEKDFPDFDEVDEKPEKEENESVKPEKKISLNEARAAFIKLKAEYRAKH